MLAGQLCTTFSDAELEFVNAEIKRISARCLSMEYGALHAFCDAAGAAEASLGPGAGGVGAGCGVEDEAVITGVTRAEDPIDFIDLINDDDADPGGGGGGGGSGGDGGGGSGGDGGGGGGGSEGDVAAEGAGSEDEVVLTCVTRVEDPIAFLDLVDDGDDGGDCGEPAGRRMRRSTLAARVRPPPRRRGGRGRGGAMRR
jgi:hypothetical protein